MKRLLALLQFTRAALAFTAVADAWAFMLLRVPGSPRPSHLVARLLLTAVAAASMYGFGMSLNDLLDARRDRIFAPWRPIPSGRLSLRTGIAVSFSLLLAAGFAAGMLGAVIARSYVPYSLLVVFVAAVLIIFYNATGKHLGGTGLLTLGLVRAANCFVGHPTKPIVLLPMFLLAHVALVSTLSYQLEGKRPRLNWRDFTMVFAGLAGAELLLLCYLLWRGAMQRVDAFLLWGPAIAMAAYAALALVVLRQKIPSRKKGEVLMLVGLFWLFAYDASILLANAQWKAALAIAALLVCCLSAFTAMRAWSRAAGQPSYRRRR